MTKKYKVLRIYEDDFGCEERAKDYEPQVIVIIKSLNDDRAEVSLKQLDAWMYEQDINEDDEVVLVEGKLRKIVSQQEEAQNI